MKAILYVVAILVTGGAAYFTLEHSRKFNDLQTDRLKTIKTDKEVSANADVKEKELKDAKTELAASEQKREEVTQSISALKSTGSTLERDVAELDSTLKDQETQFSDLNKTLEQVNQILAELKDINGGEEINLDNLPDVIQKIQDEKNARETSLEDKTTLIAGAEKRLTKNRGDLDRLVKRDIDRNSRISRNAMESVVTAVNQDWGFLVIGAGSNSGFTPQTSLIVERDGRMIGRVRPSSIEPTQTIAEIDFNSLATGVRVQPGDRVILAKPSN